ncbi:MAG: AbrB/MazE/SpoVT family DNA-binding domain-containing protein [Candidatus Eremiobacteraeota bacterium]|nr:AbrB/MazE/SpoVT family DNA-binding domain-containing protein [Candidatus Eremiobacteraeota bacterium]
MHTSKVTSKGQIVIPSRLRKKYGIREGTKICFIDDDSRIVIEPISERFYREQRGSLRGSGILEALLEERKRDREKE